jgi:hypothetical protein
VILTYKRNPRGTLQAAYAGLVRVGYVEQSIQPDRWIWSLNTIQPKGGRASGIETTEIEAKAVLEDAWAAWVKAAGLMERVA